MYSSNIYSMVETQDLAIYPLICADLICEQPNSARERINRALCNPTTPFMAHLQSP